MMKRTLILTMVAVVALTSCAYAGLFENKKISDALKNNKVKVGMTQDQLVAEIGYPPEGKAKQDALFYRFATSKVTAAGKEDSWTYQIAPTMEGVRSVTFKIVDGKVVEWNEWLDTKK